MSTLAAFRKLHQQRYPLLLGNVWDAHSAKLAQKNGFSALGTSSHAIANLLGYEDGENIPFSELLFMVEKIIAVANVPVSVDFEAGYATDPQEVAKNVQKLAAIGVAGINLEDGIVENGKRVIQDMALTVAKIKAVKAVSDIFINARIDTYTTKQENILEQSIIRATHYATAGADGIFLPLIETESDIKAFIDAVPLPLNVFITDALSDYERLEELGVKRISHGAKHYELLMKIADERFSRYAETKRYEVLLNKS